MEKRAKPQRSCRTAQAMRAAPVRSRGHSTPADAVILQHFRTEGQPMARPFGRRQKVIVREFAEKHVPRAEAKLLYEDVTPKPSPEEVELRRMARMAAPFTRPSSLGSPDKRERRALRRLKGRG